jgi:hypothetical protein
MTVGEERGGSKRKVEGRKGGIKLATSRVAEFIKVRTIYAKPTKLTR